MLPATCPFTEARTTPSPGPPAARARCPASWAEVPRGVSPAPAARDHRPPVPLRESRRAARTNRSRPRPPLHPIDPKLPSSSACRLRRHAVARRCAYKAPCRPTTTPVRTPASTSRYAAPTTVAYRSAACPPTPAAVSTPSSRSPSTSKSATTASSRRRPAPAHAAQAADPRRSMHQAAEHVLEPHAEHQDNLPQSPLPLPNPPQLSPLEPPLFRRPLHSA